MAEPISVDSVEPNAEPIGLEERTLDEQGRVQDAEVLSTPKCSVVVEHRSMIVASRVKDTNHVCNRPAKFNLDGKYVCQLHYGTLLTVKERNNQLGLPAERVKLGDNAPAADDLRGVDDGGRIEERYEKEDADTREMRWEGAGALAEREAKRKEVELQHLNAFDIKDEKARLEQERRRRNTEPDRITTVPKPESAYKTPTYLHPGSTRPEDEIPPTPVFPENPVRASNSGQPMPETRKVETDKKPTDVEETPSLSSEPNVSAKPNELDDDAAREAEIDRILKEERDKKES